ncbi:unnamed protein product, partial [Adineta steineri]
SLVKPKLNVENSLSDGKNAHPDDEESEIVIVIRELYTRTHLDAKTEKHYLSSLDGYTRLIIELSKLALKGWNAKPPRAIDIAEPCNLPTQDLHLKRVDCARYVATWDEDDQNRWHYDMIAWRWKHFPSMPSPNNPQWCGDSDDLMSRFAFFGLACHHTRKL